METWFWILGWFLSILTMTGNGFIIFLVCSKRQLRTKTNAFVVSLAVEDFYVGMSVVPLEFLCDIASGCKWLRSWLSWMHLIKWLFRYTSVTNLCSLVLDRYQPRPQGLLLVQNGGRRNPWPRLPKWLQNVVRISSRKHDEMSSFCLNNGFRLQKTNRAARHWKQPPKKPFHHVSRDKILHDSWSISWALARSFSDHHFERGEVWVV